MCEAILAPHNRIVAVHYFTALVSDTPSDPSKSIRQNTYLRALEAYIPELRVHYGHFLRNNKRRPLAANPKSMVEIIHTEEKGSDVNLAVHLLNDAWHDRYDCAAVISNDSDLEQAIALAKHRGKTVGILNTVRRPTARLQNEANFYRRIRKTHLKNSQLPDTIPGTTLTKPTGW